MPQIYDSHGQLVPDSKPGAAGSSSTGRAVEETDAEKARKRADAWNAAYFKHLGVGTGIGGAAAIDKYKKANPGWEKKRDVWAQATSAAAKAKKVAPAPGASLGSIAR